MRRFRLALPLAFVALLADCTTKDLVVDHLETAGNSSAVFGDALRFTLAFNSNAAFGLPVGQYGRWILVVIGAVVVATLLHAVFTDRQHSRMRQAGLGLILGGALGNWTSRLFSERGVVDFIDVGIGARRFYVFNVADIALSIGVCLLIVTMYRNRDEAPHTRAT